MTENRDIKPTGHRWGQIQQTPKLKTKTEKTKTEKTKNENKKTVNQTERQTFSQQRKQKKFKILKINSCFFKKKF
jgi:hypothetical protein